MNKWLLRLHLLRTTKHVELVNKYAQRISEFLTPEVSKDLRYSLKSHDDSKHCSPELEGYIHITHKYRRLSKNLPYCATQEEEALMRAATITHIRSNPHHPEYWDHDIKDEDILNTGNRDGIPPATINATKMPDHCIAEMVADWCAVSEERGTDPIAWADANINKRWRFTPHQVYLIYRCIREARVDAQD